MRIEDFESKLESDLAWRKAEVTSLILHAELEGIESLYKSTILLLYSHWEGYVKRSCKLYLQYLCEKNIKVADLTHNLKALQLKRIVGQCIESSEKLTMHNEITIINKWSQFQSKRFSLNENNTENDFERSYIDTESNLSPKVFKNILNIIGLDYKQQYQLKEQYINDRLLKNRNAIGHGSRVDNEDSQYVLNIVELKKLRDIIFLIIDATKEELIYSCEKELYLMTKEEETQLYFLERETELEKLFNQIEDQYAQ